VRSTRVEEAVAAVAAGRMIVVIDDASRENEGDLIMAAEKATPAALAFMIRHTSGVVCASLLRRSVVDASGCGFAPAG
jgi:3,4-dihydroxy 2-butanone 4-phosphate synthase/GTP cyclohydrolase II